LLAASRDPLRAGDTRSLSIPCMVHPNDVAHAAG
jgi:hypothetical protein